ncbi:MAG: ABC transporter permease [Caldilineaceae bacterium]|nr:ABC transporter permease [Caldilineaceae bacterium]
MFELMIAWRNIVARPVQTMVTILVVALAVALAVTVSHLNDGLQRGIIRASDPFGMLVVGAKGSGQQLVLSTLLLQGTPVGNISGHIYNELVADPRVAQVVPLAMGDNVGGARIIGTDHSFFDLRPTLQDPPAFQLAAGRLFADDFEVVLGSRAAQALGLSIGDHFVPAHGVERGLESDEHGTVHTVTGILLPSATPFDSAAFTTVDSVIALHDEEEPGGTTAVADVQAGKGTGAGAVRWGDAGIDHVEDGRVTALLVRPMGFVEANQLWRDFYVGTEAQAVFPGRELGGLFDLLNQGQEILGFVGYLTSGMAALTLFLAVYSVTSVRQHLLAILRGVGANRSTVFRIVLAETIVMALLGALTGRVLGYLAAVLIGNQLALQSAIPVEIRYLPGLEPVLWLLPLALGVLAGLLPAWQAYRVNVVEKLFPS